MSLLRRATESGGGDWKDVPEGLWRWKVGQPTLVKSEKFGNYRVKFPLLLTDDEKARLEAEHGKPPEGVNQSWRTSYSVGLSLGWIKNGAYQTTKLVDFLAACFGSQNQRRFREWIAGGGGPDTSGAHSDEEEMVAIINWLNWWSDLELYGTVRHEPDANDPKKLWARFAGPMAVGSLPGQKDDEYQAFGRGKFRAMQAETGAEVVPLEAAPKPEPMPVAVGAGVTADRYQQIFGEEDDEAA